MTCSTPRRWPRLLCADTAPCRGLRLRTVVAISFSFRGARRARPSSDGEPADRPQSSCLCALRAWRGCLRGQLTTCSTSHRQPRLLCAESRLVGGCGFEPSFPSLSRRVARCARARASSGREPADRPQSTCLCALRAWRSCLRGQLAALQPTPLAEAPLRRHRALNAVAASNRRSRRFLVRGARRARASSRG